MQSSIANYLYSKLAAAALLATAMTVLTGALQAQPAASGQKRDPLIGTWILTVKPSSGPVFFQIENYAPGETITAIDNYSSSSLETISVGPWRKVGPGKYYEDNESGNTYSGQRNQRTQPGDQRGRNGKKRETLHGVACSKQRIGAQESKLQSQELIETSRQIIDGLDPRDAIGERETLE